MREQAPVARQVGFVARGNEEIFDLENGRRTINLEEKIQKFEAIPNTTTMVIYDTDRNTGII